jgi:high-affinity iron transporter
MTIRSQKSLNWKKPTNDQLPITNDQLPMTNYQLPIMEFSAALPTFIITLREGVEAALVVGIVLAYIKKAQQTQLNVPVYAGVGVGIVASAVVGLLFALLVQGVSAANREYEPAIKQLMEGGFSVVAIAMLSWMLIWMTRQARTLKAEVETAVNTALEQNNRAAIGIFSLICIAVLREGFETVVFILAQVQQGWIAATLGATAGLIGAIGIGFLLFAFGVKINLRQFFQIMGIFLLLIVSGLVLSALGHFDKALNYLLQINPDWASFCFFQTSCILGPMVWNTSTILPERQFPGIILHVLFGYPERLYLAQAIAYTLFISIVGRLYWKSLSPQARLR